MNFSVEKLSKLEYYKLMRCRMGYTQAEMADKLGFSAIYYRYWENGIRRGKRVEERFNKLLASNRRKKPSEHHGSL